MTTYRSSDFGRSATTVLPAAHRAQLMIGLSPAGEVHLAAGAVMAITGYSTEALIGRNWWSTLIAPLLMPIAVNRLRAELQAGTLHHFELALATRSGNRRHLYWQVLRGSATQIILMGEVVETSRVMEPTSPAPDCSDDHSHALTAQPRPSLADVVAGSYQTAIALIEPETDRILDVNAPCVNLYGYPRDRLLGMRLNDLVATDAALRTAKLRSIPLLPPAGNKPGELPPQTEWHRQADGQIFPVQIRGISGQWQTRSARVDTPPQCSQVKMVVLQAAVPPHQDESAFAHLPHEQLLGQLIQRVHASIDPRQVFPPLVNEIRQLFDCDRVLVYQLQASGQGIVLTEAVLPDWPSIQGQIIHDERFYDYYAHLYTAGRIQVIPDIQTANLTDCHHDLLAQLGVRANLVVPITDQQDLWGLLVAQHCRGVRQWEPWEIQFLRQIANQTAIAIRQFKLRQQSQAELQRRQQTQAALQVQLQQERLIRGITQRMRQSLDLDTILNTTVQEVRQLLQTDRVVIFQFWQGGKGQVVVESVAAPWPALIDLMIHDPCFDARYKVLYQSGRSHSMDDVDRANLPACYVEMLRSFQVRANLVVPILHTDEIWGLLIAHHCQAPRHWQTTEVELLKQLGDQVGIAIHQAELYQQVQTLNVELEATVAKRTQQLRENLAYDAILKQITDKVRASLDEAQMLEEVVQTLGANLAVDYCSTGIYNPAQTEVTITHEYTGRLRPVRGQTLEFSPNSLIYLELRQGHTVQVCDLGSDTLHDLHSRYSLLACPIVDDQMVLGDLWLLRPREESFNPAEVNLVQHVAQHCAIALRQARLYQAAQAQVQALARLNRLKDDFLSTVSHELRTPMASIQLATNMVQLYLDQLDIPAPISEHLDRYLTILIDEGDREITLINDLLDLSRLEAGTEPLSLTEIDLRNWIPHILEGLEPRIQAQHQTLHIEMEPELPPIQTDLSFLERSLRELMQNAYKYTPAEEHIYIRAQRRGDRCRICVENTGIEIPVDEHDRVFDKFYRIPNQDPWKHGGTGLGLALVKRMVRHLGGDLSLHTRPNRTQFCLDLPLHLESEPMDSSRG